MCRNIRTLHNFEPPATEDEVQAAALQYVRKISGYTKPSQANEAAFDRAVEEVAAAAHLGVDVGVLRLELRLRRLRRFARNRRFIRVVRAVHVRRTARRDQHYRSASE